MDKNPRQAKTNYINTLDSNAFHVLLDKPTRITHNSEILIDHVICNYIRPDTTTGTANHKINDHLQIFLALTSLPNSKEPSNDLFRCLKQFNPNAYIHDLHRSLETWYRYHSFSFQHESNFNIVFRNFVKPMQSVVNNHAPMKPYLHTKKHYYLNRGYLMAYIVCKLKILRALK